MAFRGNFLVKVSVEVTLAGDPARLLPHRLRPDDVRRRLVRGAIPLLRRLLLRAERPDRDALPRKLQRVRRAGPHRRPRLPPAQADRRAVPHHLPADRLGHRPERPDGRRRDGPRPAADGLALRPGHGCVGFLVLFACGTAIAYSFMLVADPVLGLDGPQPEPDGDVVALLQPRPLPQGDLRRHLGRADRLVLHLRPADPAGRQRPRRT